MNSHKRETFLVLITKSTIYNNACWLMSTLVRYLERLFEKSSVIYVPSKYERTSKSISMGIPCVSVHAGKDIYWGHTTRLPSNYGNRTHTNVDMNSHLRVLNFMLTKPTMIFNNVYWWISVIVEYLGSFAENPIMVNVTSPSITKWLPVSVRY